MVDLDSNPTKLIEVVEIGKQLLITRGALTTFSVANDVAKYFAIIPAMFAGAFPQLRRAERHGGCKTPQSAILVGRDFQRAHHHRARAAGAARRALPSAGRRGAAALESSGLRTGRNHRAIHRNQAHRPDHYRTLGGREAHMKKNLLISIWFTLVTTVLLGIIYPLVVTGLAQMMFPKQANGELITQGGKLVGSHLIGQPFTAPGYFYSRPSAAGAAGMTPPRRVAQTLARRTRRSLTA